MDKTNNIILDSEKLFAIKINNYLNKNNANWIIHKSEFKYSHLDFLLINLNNLYSVYIEYKERCYAVGYTSYETYFISLKKFYAIKKHYHNCYIIFDFTHSTKNEDEFYYIKYDKELFDTFEKDLDKSRLLIPSNLCKTNFDNMTTELIDMIPSRNLL